MKQYSMHRTIYLRAIREIISYIIRKGIIPNICKIKKKKDRYAAKALTIMIMEKKYAL